MNGRRSTLDTSSGGRAMRDRSVGGAITAARPSPARARSEEHTSELQSRQYLVCRLLLEKKKQKPPRSTAATTPPRATPLAPHAEMAGQDQEPAHITARTRTTSGQRFR